jgi:hypothetical protein
VLALLLAILGIIAGSHISALERLYPYSQYWDEGFISRPIWHMIQNDDLNPRMFRYPSLPIYLAYASIAASSASSGENTLEQLRTTTQGAPYSPASLFWAPRLLFVLMSLGAAFFLALIAWRAFGPAEALLVPLLLSLSAVYQVSAVTYMNVDVVTIFFASATLASVIGAWNKQGYFAKAVLPGLLAGMTIASKYNSGLILVPCALAIFYTCRAQRVALVGVLGLAAALAFFVCVPYSLITPQAFIDQLFEQIAHYQSGSDAAHVSEPGLDKLTFYLRAIGTDFGLPLVCFGIYGLVEAWRRDRAKLLVLIALPALMLMHMSTNRVNYVRSILPVFAIFTLVQALGLTTLARLLLTWGSRLRDARRTQEKAPRLLGWPATAGMAGVLLLACAPNPGLLLDLNIRADTRNRTEQWLLGHAPAGSAVLISETLHMSESAYARLAATRVPNRPKAMQRALQKSRLARRFVVMPDYEHPEAPRSAAPRRGDTTGTLASELSILTHAPGAKRAHAVPGLPFEAPAVGHRGGRPGLSPSIVIYEIPPG